MEKIKQIPKYQRRREQVPKHSENETMIALTHGPRSLVLHLNGQFGLTTVLSSLTVI